MLTTPASARPDTTHRPRWRRRLLAPLVASTLVLASCGGDDGGGGGGAAGPVDSDDYTGAVRDVSEQGDPVTGGAITVGLEAETNSWLPGEATFADSGINVAYAIYDPLMKRTADGGVAPYLAESLEPNDDLSEWTLTLRPDIDFHDGTPLDAEALKTIFDDYLTAETSNQAITLSMVESMEIVDDLTVTYVLDEPVAAFADVLADAPGWPFSPTAAADAGEDAGANPVGTGPFRFVSWQRDSQLVVERNEDYWQEGLPYLDRITFRPIPDEDTRRSSLTSGDIDVLQSLRQSAVVATRDLDGIDRYELLGNNSGGNIINTGEPPFDDVRVRRAMAYAIDQEGLIDVLGGTGVTPPQTQLFSPDSPFYSEDVAEEWPTGDPARAAELYQEYIDDPERSDGQPVGTGITIDYDCPPDPSLNELAQLYQVYWQAAGFDVTLNQVEQATHVNEALTRDYQVKCFRFGSPRDPYFTVTEGFTPGPLNFTDFTHPDIDDALETLRTTVDEDERVEAIEQISMTVTENVPVTFSGSTLMTFAVRSEVKNVDGWTFPDGTEGSGNQSAAAMWGHVWLAD